MKKNSKYNLSNFFPRGLLAWDPTHDIKKLNCEKACMEFFVVSLAKQSLKERRQQLTSKKCQR